MPLKPVVYKLMENVARRKTTEKAREHGVLQKTAELGTICGTDVVIFSTTADGVVTAFSSRGDPIDHIESLLDLSKKRSAEDENFSEDGQYYFQFFNKDNIMNKLQKDEKGRRKVKYEHPAKKTRRESQNQRLKLQETRTKTTNLHAGPSVAGESKDIFTQSSSLTINPHNFIDPTHMTMAELNEEYDVLTKLAKHMGEKAFYDNIEKQISTVVPNPIQIALEGSKISGQQTVETSRNFSSNMSEEGTEGVTIETEQTVTVKTVTHIDMEAIDRFKERNKNFSSIVDFSGLANNCENFLKTFLSK